MATTFTPTAVHALLDAVPIPVLTLAPDGAITFANRAAKSHPGRPIDALNGKPVIKAMLRDMTLGKVKLPYSAEVELNGGIKVKGQFLAGLGGLEIAFLIHTAAPAGQDRSVTPSGLSEVMALLRDEVTPPLKRVSALLGDLPESPQAEQLEEAAQALDQRIRRLNDLIAVFGDEVLVTSDRIELAEMVQSVCQELTPRALAKKVHFEITPPSQTVPPIYGNAEIIRRAFYECIDNAVTHSRKEVNSRQDLVVKVTYNLTGEHVLISVRNLGAMPEESHGIETRDLLARGSGASAPESTGRLGLPLVRRIVGMHGGNMRMTAVGDDEVRVLMEFPTGAPQRGQAQLDIAQAQRYAADLAQLMSRRKKEPV